MQRNKKSRNSQGNGSLGEKKQRNERRKAVQMKFQKTAGLYRVCEELPKSAHKVLTF